MDWQIAGLRAEKCERIFREKASGRDMQDRPELAKQSYRYRSLVSKEPRWPHHRAPHVCGGPVVEAQAFFGLLEIAPDDADEVVEAYLSVWIERVDVIDRDQARCHVPLVISGALVFLDDVGLGLVVGSMSSRPRTRL